MFWAFKQPAFSRPLNSRTTSNFQVFDKVVMVIITDVRIIPISLLHDKQIKVLIVPEKQDLVNQYETYKICMHVAIACRYNLTTVCTRCLYIKMIGVNTAKNQPICTDCLEGRNDRCIQFVCQTSYRVLS